MKNINYSGGEDMDKPIQLLARDCDKFFQESLTNPHHALADPDEVALLTREYYEGFIAWTAFLSVFEGNESCLDNRLQKQQALQDIIIRLLEILRRNTYFLSISVDKTGSSEEEESFNRGTLDSILPETQATFSGIRNTLSSLTRLAITIRQPSRPVVETLARNYATTSQSLDELENITLISLEILYPNAPESLRKQLCDTMTDRYAKLVYYKHCKIKERQSRELAPVFSTETVWDSEVVQKPRPTPTFEQASDDWHQRPLSSIDTAILRENLGDSYKPVTTQSMPTASMYQSDNQLCEPQPPQFEDGKTDTACKWCQENINQSLLSGKGWSDEGRKHYRQDLKPFSCLSEACKDSRPSFPTRGEWQNHMASCHTPSWSQRVHKQPMWRCNDHVEADRVKTNYAFCSYSAFQRHMDVLHPQNILLSTNNPEGVTHPSMLDEPLPLDLCPLCLYVGQTIINHNQDMASQDVKRASGGCSPEPEMSDKKHSKQREGRFAIAEVPEENNASFSEFNNGLEDNLSTPFELNLHIAAHLQYLMTLSLRLMATLDCDGEDDTQSKSGASAAADIALGEMLQDEIVADIDSSSLPLDFAGTDFDNKELKLEDDRILYTPDIPDIPDIEAEEIWTRVSSFKESSEEDPILIHFQEVAEQRKLQDDANNALFGDNTMLHQGDLHYHSPTDNNRESDDVQLQQLHSLSLNTIPVRILPPPPVPSSDPRLYIESNKSPADLTPTKSNDEYDLFKLKPLEALQLLSASVELLVHITDDVPPTLPPKTQIDPQMSSIQAEKERITQPLSKKSPAQLQAKQQIKHQQEEQQQKLQKQSHLSAGSAEKERITQPLSKKSPAQLQAKQQIKHRREEQQQKLQKQSYLSAGSDTYVLTNMRPKPDHLKHPRNPYPVIIGTDSQPLYLQHSAIIRKFYSKNDPPISVHQYLLRLHQFCPMSTAVYLATSLYIHRLAVEERVISITKRNAHRLVLAGLRVAMKALEDLSYPHMKVAKVGGVSEVELARLEISFCFLVGFELIVSEELLKKHWKVLKDGKIAIDSIEVLKPKLENKRKTDREVL